MAVSVENGDLYFSALLHHEAWVEADAGTKQRALHTAEQHLYRLYRTYNPDTRPLPDEAVYEQALWLLRMDDATRRAEMGVRSMSASGVSVSAERPDSIAPQAVLILGRRMGRSVR